MKKKGILEVSADSVESAVNAEQGGADRIELCGDLIVGGVTPSLALFQRIREKTQIPVHVLIRPRFGDFLYSEEELEVLYRQIQIFCEAGADAIVTGVLTKEGMLDAAVMDRIRSLTGDKKLCLHRAFDMCADREAALALAKEYGVDTILTSGGRKSAVAGMENLEKIKSLAGPVDIMAGAGVCADNIKKLHEETGITTFHMSGKVTLESGMEFRNPHVSMGLDSLSEYELIRTSEEKVREAVKVVRTL